MKIEQTQEFMEMLTGKQLPDGMQLPNQPQLLPEAAFNIIWYLQEHLRIIPDNFEMCCVCHRIFDIDNEGWSVSDDYDSWYQDMGISKSEMLTYQGEDFCSEKCEIIFWRDKKRIAAGRD